MLLTLASASAQIQTNYYDRNDFLMASAGSFQDGLVGFANPANLALIKAPESRFYWSTDGVNSWSFKNWGLFLGVPHLGFGIQRQKYDTYRVNDYRLSIAFGSDAQTLGIAYGWSSGDKDYFGREKLLSVGTLMRPFEYVSLGLVGNYSLQSKWNECIAELGVRPLGTSRVTLFADAALERGMKVEDMSWSAGTTVEIVKGINLTGRYFDNKSFTVGMTINFGTGGFGGKSHFDNNGNHARNVYYLRAGGMKPSIFPRLLGKNKRYLPLDMKGRINYQKYLFFDSKTQRFMDILNNIQAAIDDPRVAAIAMNLSGMKIYPEHAWEIREELKKAQQSGKKIIAFIDNAEMTTYHLASVADKIVLDPQGTIALVGYNLNRTFFKGTLEKLGFGFDEWRFFKYKSAAEVLSRDKMSEADYEQRQDYVDDWYEITRDDVCTSRLMSHTRFDEIVNDQSLFLADGALEWGLVDTLARWSDKDKIIYTLTGRPLQGIKAKNLLTNTLPPRKWGERPKIAVVYGLGVCDMDTGIKARRLESLFLRLAKNKSIRAVVFRVDSPGGDGMASDLVAEAVKKCARVKPVIVSQGQVAGSGGYWISMYGDKIVAGANSFTGSIGVIGGWLYDKGIGDKIGMTSDHVKRGEHADLGVGITLPLLGLTIPARNLTTEEYSKMEKLIRKYYDIFVKKVAQGRNLPVDEVREIAEGHFYSGLDGKEIGLVDEIGGLMTALAIARQDAGLKPDEEVDIIEISKYKGLFDFKSKPLSISETLEDNPTYQYIKMCSERRGQPLPMLVPGTYPTLE
jgi:protease-4